ncbi:MAG: O-antigen ligase family protein [Pseudomonadota bacterium]
MSAGTSTLDRIIDGLFIVAMSGVAVLAVFGHRGVAPCVGFMALGVALRGRTWRAGFGLLSPRRLLADPLSIAAIATLGFSLWVAVTMFWSPVPGAEWLALTVLVSALGAGALVFEAQQASPRRTRLFSNVFIGMVCVASAALMFEGLSGAYLRHVFPPEDLSPLRWKDFVALGRGVTAMAPLVFPAAVLLRRLTGSWWVAFSPAAALYIAAGNFSIFANVAGLSAGALAFAAALYWPRVSIKFWSALIVAALIAVPFVASILPAEAVQRGDYIFIPASWALRLVAWREAAEAALGSCFPIGCGADYARALSEQGVTIEIPGWPIALPTMPVHPHNLFLQIWLELGLPGVILFAVAFIDGAMALLKARIDARAYAAIAAVAAVSFISVMFEASLWQVWRLSVFALAAFGCAVSYSANKS